MSEIEKALLIKDETESILEIQEILWKKTELFDDFGNLNEAEKTFLYVEILEAEINNGGFDQFFFNSSGDYANEILEALKKIGALKTVKIVEEAYKNFPENPIPKDNNIRREILENINEQTSEKWTQLEDKFYLYEENIGGLVLDYVRKNINKFK
ncbi:DMP19 family protein [Flavobacterium sp.]